MRIDTISSGFEPDLSLVLDDASLPHYADSGQMSSLQERLALMQHEHQVAYSQMHRMALDIRALRLQLQASLAKQTASELACADALFRFARLAGFRKDGSLASIWRVGVMSALLAHAAGEPDAFCDHLQWAAPLHDIGELALPDSVLRSTRPTVAKGKQHALHCDFGYVLFNQASAPELQMAAEIALGHHECFDGGGYPAGLRGLEIPRSAAIVALIEHFECLTHPLPGEPVMSAEAAILELEQGAGLRFDPELVSVFVGQGGIWAELCAEIDEKRIQREPRLSWMRKPPERGSWRRFL